MSNLPTIERKAHMEVYKLLFQSSFLSISDSVRFHEMVTKKPFDMVAYILSSEGKVDVSLRFGMWKASILRFSDLHLDISLIGIYKSIASKNMMRGITIISPGMLGDIRRDAIRTYQNCPSFKENGMGHTMLVNVLSAIATHRSDVGYCQGMNFVVGTMIIARLPELFLTAECDLRIDKNMESTINSPAGLNHESTTNRTSPSETTHTDSTDSNNALSLEGEPTISAETTQVMAEVEADVFSLVSILLEKRCKLALNGIWQDKIPKMKLRVYQLDRLLKWYYPKLHQHMVHISLSPEVLSAQWFITLFSYSMPVNMILQIWDYIFATGWEGLFQVAISLLGSLEDQILELDTEGVAVLMRDWKRAGGISISKSTNELLKRASVLVINKEVLVKLEEAFAREIMQLSHYTNHATLPSPAEFDQSSRAKLFFGGSADSRDNGKPASHISRPNSLRRSRSDSKEGNDRLKEKIKLGEEEPTFWLLRYGEKLTQSQAHELMQIQLDLKTMEEQTESDKNYIQSRIIVACNRNRETQEELSEALQWYNDMQEAVRTFQEEFEEAIEDAQDIAMDAAAITSTITSKQTSPQLTDNDFKYINSNTMEEEDGTTQASLAREDTLDSLEREVEEEAATGLSSGKLYRPSLESLGNTNTTTAMTTVTLTNEFSSHDKSSRNAVKSSSCSNWAATGSEDHTSGGLELDAITSETATTISTTASTTGDEVESNIGSHSPFNAPIDSEGEVPCGHRRCRSSPVGSLKGLHLSHLSPRSQSPTPPSLTSSLTVSESAWTSPSSPSRPPPSSSMPFRKARRSLPPTPTTTLYLKSIEKSPTTTPSPSTSVPLSREGSTQPPHVFLSPPSFFLAPTRHLTSPYRDKDCAAASSGISSPASHNSNSTKSETSVLSTLSLSIPSSSSSSSSSFRLYNNVSSLFSRRSPIAGPIEKLKALEKHSQQHQLKIIEIHRSLEEAKKSLLFARKRLENANIADEEAVEWKKCLCDQLQLFVRDSNRGRSQKLLYVSEQFML